MQLSDTSGINVHFSLKIFLIFQMYYISLYNNFLQYVSTVKIFNQSYLDNIFWYWWYENKYISNMFNS
jgi:hypothetical protein